MSSQADIERARRWYAQDLRAAAPVVNNPDIVEAFARVPREAYLGPGPWRMHTRLGRGNIGTTPSADPRHVYHDLPVVIDEARGLNNGQPSLWAYVFDHLDIAPGDTVLQVGTGTGYYTAILAELVGRQGRVLAYEIDISLFERTAKNIGHHGHVDARPGDATKAADLPAIDAGVVCAGVTHVPEPWLSRLSDGGRMMLPFTGDSGGGFMLLLRRDGDTYPITSLGPCGFYDCAGARRKDEEKALTEALNGMRGRRPELGFYHPGPAPRGAGDVLFSCDAYWISTA